MVRRPDAGAESSPSRFQSPSDAVLHIAPPVRMVDQDAAHQLGGERNEMSPVLPLGFGETREA